MDLNTVLMLTNGMNNHTLVGEPMTIGKGVLKTSLQGVEMTPDIW